MIGGAFVALIAAASVAVACGSGSRPKSAATPAPAFTHWWSEAARFVPAHGYITYISNMGSLATKFGAPQPMLTCSELFGSPTPVGLDGVRAANGHGGLPELLGLQDLSSVDRDAGFDPCSANIVVDAEIGDGSLPNPGTPEDMRFDVYSQDGDGSKTISTLREQGYSQGASDNAKVLSKGNDGEIASDKYFSILNRVAVLPGWVVTAHSTPTMQLALDARGPTTAPRNTLNGPASLLSALGNFDSVAILDDMSSSQPAIESDIQRRNVKLPRSWGTLHAPTQALLAYERTPQHTNQLKVELYYADGAGGEADATELTKRLDSYQSQYFQHALCSGAQAMMTRAKGASSVVATCTTTDDITLTSIVEERDLAFLVHQAPAIGKP
jgi:hypothetical protein